MTDTMNDRLAHANDLREQEKFSESNKEYTDCLIELIPLKDIDGLVHCLCGQALVYKILARKTQDQIYRNLTLAFSKSAYDLVSPSPDKIDPYIYSLALINYADGLFINGKFHEALPLYQKSHEVSNAPIPEKGRTKAHIGFVMYLTGQKEDGIKMIEEGLVEIRTGDMAAYNIRVWETGALNSLAKASFIDGDKEKALNIIDESVSIASVHDLKIRKREAEEIKEKIIANQTDFSL